MWTFRRSSCKGVYTHPDIIYQVIVDNQTLKITWKEKEFNSVAEAKSFAERMSFPQNEYPDSTGTLS